MFERIVVSSPTRRSWRSLVLGVSISAHAVLVVLLLVAGMWQLERLVPPSRRLVLAVSAPPRVEAAAPAPTRTVDRPKVQPRRRPTALTQPVAAPTEDIDVHIASGEHDGQGQGHGTGLGAATGSASALDEIAPLPVEPLHIKPVKPPPPPRARPVQVPASVLEGKRIAGNARIMPPDPVQLAMVREDMRRVEATITMCLEPDGRVRSASVQTSSGYDAYDRTLVAEMLAWRYEPYRVNDTPIPVCAPIRFIYVLQP